MKKRKTRKPRTKPVYATVETITGLADLAASVVEKQGNLVGRIMHVESEIRNLVKSTGGYWLMEDGTLMQIRQMSDSHLHNAIRRFKPQGTRADSIKHMEQEQARRVIDKEWARRTKSCPDSVEQRLGRLEEMTGPGGVIQKEVHDLKRAAFDNAQAIGQRKPCAPPPTCPDAAGFRNNLAFEDVPFAVRIRAQIRQKICFLRQMGGITEAAKLHLRRLDELFTQLP